MKNENAFLAKKEIEIKAAYKQYLEDTEAPYQHFIKEKNAAYAAYQEKEKQLANSYNEVKSKAEKPLVALMEEYFDATLVDWYEKPIRVNDVITNGKKSYRVVQRLMDTYKGEFRFNPRVVCEQIFVREKKRYTFAPWELHQKFTITEMDNAEIKVEVTGEGGQA